jgi:hypothetical protein
LRIHAYLWCAGALSNNSLFMKKLRAYRLLGGGNPFRSQEEVTAADLAVHSAALQAQLWELDFLVQYWVRGCLRDS